MVTEKKYSSACQRKEMKGRMNYKGAGRKFGGGDVNGSYFDCADGFMVYTRHKSLWPAASKMAPY